MGIKMGIVGLPNVGKSTLFNALTANDVPAENYPFCTIDPSVGIVEVPDERLDKLAEFSKSEKKIPAVVEFVDIAGLVEGASSGQGLGNKFLANIREVDAICHVVRLFGVEDRFGNTVNHVYGDVNPERDIDVIEMELILADLSTVEGRLEKLKREVRGGDKEAIKKNELFERIKNALEDGKLARTMNLGDEEVALARELHLLTMKPTIYIFNYNGNADNFNDVNSEEFGKLVSDIRGGGSDYIIVDVNMERDTMDMSSEERREFLPYADGADFGLDKLVRKSYDLLGRISFFTTGEKESRAWTIKKGSTAKQAGGAIHNDFSEKFIRAEVISWDKLLEFDSYAGAKDAGAVFMAGKDYVVNDGDVIVFRI